MCCGDSHRRCSTSLQNSYRLSDCVSKTLKSRGVSESTGDCSVSANVNSKQADTISAVFWETMRQFISV